MASQLRLCADWEPHSYCLLAWAVHPEWDRSIRDVKAELRNVITTIAEYERVRLLAPPDQIVEAKQQCFGQNVEIIEAPVDDIWMRDIAPTFGRRGDEIVAMDWSFNGWGSTRDRKARPGDNRQGINAPRGGSWHPTAVARLLSCLPKTA